MRVLLRLITRDRFRRRMILQTSFLLSAFVTSVLPSCVLREIEIEDEPIKEVIFVNVIFRHGARAPDKTYKNDPYKNAFPVEIGELTNEGKLQQYELGKWLRQRYGQLLTDRYSPNLVRMLASDSDRVLMSAQCCLAGLYPPKNNQVWNPDLNWQPFPIHTIPQNMDKLLAMKAPCSAYDKEFEKVLQSDEIKTIRKKHQDMVEILNKYTGETRDDYKYIPNIYDTLKVQSEYGFPLPWWAKDIFPERMEEATLLRFTLPTWNKKLARLKTGPLIEEFITNMESKVNGSETRVMKMYAGHDTTIVPFLHSLDVWDHKMLPYSTCVLLELRRDCQGDHYVQLFVYTNADARPKLLRIPGCDAACPLDKFVSLTGYLVPKDWTGECAK